MSCSNTSYTAPSACTPTAGPTIIRMHVNSNKAREMYEAGQFPMQFRYTEGDGERTGWGYAEMSDGWITGYDGPQPGYDAEKFKAQIYQCQDHRAIDISMQPKL